MVGITLMFFSPFLFLLLPANYFDKGESFCPSKRLLNIECLGCGITRAVQHLIHFQFKEAWHFNKLSFLLVPFFGYFWTSQTLKLIKKIKT